MSTAGGEINRGALYAVTLTASLFTFAGTSALIVSFFTLRSLRNVLAFRLVFFMSCMDWLTAVANFFGDQNDGSFGCTFQAVIISFADLSSAFWAAVIAFTLHFCFLHQSFSKDEMAAQMKYFMLVAWGVPLVLTLLPFITDSYGESNGWCWLRPDEVGKLWMYIQLYVPVWIIIGYICFVYCRVWSRMRQAEDASGDPARKRTIARIKYYPMVLILCWIMATINRVSQLFIDPPINGLVFAHVVGTSSRGFWNSIVYGLNPLVQASVAVALAATFPCCACLLKVAKRASETEAEAATPDKGQVAETADAPAQGEEGAVHLSVTGANGALGASQGVGAAAADTAEESTDKGQIKPEAAATPASASVHAEGEPLLKT